MPKTMTILPLEKDRLFNRFEYRLTRSQQLFRVKSSIIAVIKGFLRVKHS
jgi:hypothetical protein